MDEDARYAYPCRLGLLAASALHWVAAAWLVYDNTDGASTWEFSRTIRRLAVAIAEVMIGA